MNSTPPLELPQVRRAHIAFNERWKAKGGKLTKYVCSHCGEQIEIRQPAKGDVQVKGFWNSMTRCIECGELNFVKVYPSGMTIVTEV